METASWQTMRLKDSLDRLWCSATGWWIGVVRLSHVVHAVPISFSLFQEMRSYVTAYSFHKTLNSPVKRKKDQLYKSRGTAGSVAVAQSPDLSLTEM